MKHYFLLLLLIGCIASGHAESGWKAHWINTERCQSETNTWLAFRKTVHIDKVPQTLTARIAADSKYWLWINGRLVVFEGGLKRGPSPYDTYYDPVEIAPYLQNGENTIAVLVWHFGKSGFSHVNSGLAALLFEAVALVSRSFPTRAGNAPYMMPIRILRRPIRIIVCRKAISVSMLGWKCPAGISPATQARCRMPKLFRLSGSPL